MRLVEMGQKEGCPKIWAQNTPVTPTCTQNFLPKCRLDYSRPMGQITNHLKFLTFISQWSLDPATCPYVKVLIKPLKIKFLDKIIWEV